jgi:rubrerythrin
MNVNRKCLACGFIDKYQYKIQNCPKCQERYKDRIRSKNEVG